MFVQRTVVIPFGEPGCWALPASLQEPFPLSGPALCLGLALEATFPGCPLFPMGVPEEVPGEESMWHLGFICSFSVLLSCLWQQLHPFSTTAVSPLHASALPGFWKHHVLPVSWQPQSWSCCCVLHTHPLRAPCQHLCKWPFLWTIWGEFCFLPGPHWYTLKGYLVVLTRTTRITIIMIRLHIYYVPDMVIRVFFLNMCYLITLNTTLRGRDYH